MIHIAQNKITLPLPPSSPKFETHILDEAEYTAFRENSKALSNFLIRDHYVFSVQKKEVNGSFIYILVPIGTEAEISCRWNDINTKRQHFTVLLFNGVEMIEVETEPTIQTSVGIKELISYGCLVSEAHTKEFIEYLIASSLKAPIKYKHSELGWLFDKKAFLLDKCIGGVESKYTGNFVLSPCGSKEAYLSMIKNQVIDMKLLPMQLFFVLGFASPVLSILNRDHDLGCMVVNVANSSSKGKTTAILLAASVFSQPKFNKGLITTFSGTQNALYSFTAKANGLTVCLDELATADSHEFRKFLYQICSGVERRRLNTSGELKDVRCFDSIILTTAEYPIVDETASNGIRARVFEIQDTLTQDAQNSNAIKKCVLSNYALLGRGFIEYLIKEFDNIESDYCKELILLRKAFEKTNYRFSDLTERILAKFAVIILTAKYINRCFDLRIDVGGLSKYLLSIEQTVSENSKLEEKAIICILDYVTKNLSMFSKANNNTNNTYYASSAVGIIKISNEKRQVFIMKSVVTKILKDNHFENPDVILKTWRTQGMIVTEKDRSYIRIKISEGVSKTECIGFNIPEDLSLESEETKDNSYAVKDIDDISF